MVEDNQYYNVAIIGAGPMGSYAATQLAQSGLNVVQLEKDDIPGDSTVCAGGMHKDILNFIGFPESVLDRHLRSFRVTTNDKNTDWDFDDDLYLMADRQRVDVEMGKMATNSGVIQLTGARVMEVNLNGHYLLYRDEKTKESRKIKAEVFVFADGVNSVGRSLLPNQKPLSKREQAIGVEYDLKLDGGNSEFNQVEIITNRHKLPFGYYWIFPKNGHVNVGVGRSAESKGESLWKMLDEFVESRPDLRGKKRICKKGGVIPIKVSTTLQVKNGLFIGDAAGMVNPITGGGYVCGFMSAHIAAKTIAEAFREGSLNQTILQKYSRRMMMTKHYVVIKLAYYVLYSFFLCHRYLSISVYPVFFKLYTHLIHRMMRFSSVF